MKVGEKYRLKNLFKNDKCEIVEIISSSIAVIGFDNSCGWANKKLREKTGYKFFWAVDVGNLERTSLLEIE